MLGREPDARGLAEWTKVLKQGYPFSTVINGFCKSDEFGNVCSQYGITPGTVTVKVISEKGASITPKNSEPNKATKAVRTLEYTNEEKIRAFVQHCYRSVLGRDADEEGLKGYTESILKGIKTPKQVAHEFIFSGEFQNRLPGNEDLIRILYQLYLYRDADEAGLAEWVGQLNAGASLEAVADGLAGSAEFKKIIRNMK